MRWAQQAHSQHRGRWTRPRLSTHTMVDVQAVKLSAYQLQAIIVQETHGSAKHRTTPVISCPRKWAAYVGVHPLVFHSLAVTIEIRSCHKRSIQVDVCGQVQTVRCPNALSHLRSSINEPVSSSYTTSSRSCSSATDTSTTSGIRCLTYASALVRTVRR